MQTSPTHHCRNGGAFDQGNPLGERGARWALWITLIAMLAEILGGWWYGSMSLLADGWHMATDALALALAVWAYGYARRHIADPRFAFGTWKVEVLASYTSALLLLAVAAWMVYESIHRFLHPVPIHYNEALTVALVGLIVNILSARLLHAGHGHDDHNPAHVHDEHRQDLNLRAAYLHMLADIATSVLAIVALAGGKWWGMTALDPVGGMVCSMVLIGWGVSLLRQSIKVLLDAHMTDPVAGEIRQAVAQTSTPAQIEDLHLWRVGKGRYSVLLSIRSIQPDAAQEVREALSAHAELVHVTVEWLPTSGQKEFCDQQKVFRTAQPLPDQV